MQNSPLLQLALIGPTASGKSALALQLAKEHRGIILSLDSLSIYRQIDIASAKPSPQERQSVPHFGIDILDPDDSFDVLRFVELYRAVSQRARREGRPLLIVGGSSFYLKILLEGISPLPTIEPKVQEEVEKLMSDPSQAWELLRSQAPDISEWLNPSDSYRIEKSLLILLQTGQSPREYFKSHPPQPVIQGAIGLFEILQDRAHLRERILQRTDVMLKAGLVDEVAALEARYGRAHNPMKAIGIREVLAYFDGIYSYEQMREKIVVDTARLAKRQRTFNASQFSSVVREEPSRLLDAIGRYLERAPTGR